MSAKVILKNGKEYEDIDSLEIYTAIDYVEEGRKRVEKNEIEFVLRDSGENVICVGKADRLGELVIKGDVGKLDSDTEVHVIGNVDFLKAECAYIEGNMSGAAGENCVVESNPTMKLLSLDDCSEVVVEGDLSKILIRVNGYSNEVVSVIGGVVSLYGNTAMIRGDAKLGRVEEKLIVKGEFTGNWKGHKLVDGKWVEIEDKEAC